MGIPGVPVTLLTKAVGAYSNVLHNAPVVGSMHNWTEQRATNSKAARELLRLVVYICIGCMMYILRMTFKLIMAGKLDATAGTVVGGSFTLLGGILAVTIPAFVSALNAADQPPPTTPPADKAP